MIASLPETSTKLIPGKTSDNSVSKKTASALPFSSALDQASQNLHSGPETRPVASSSRGQASRPTTRTKSGQEPVHSRQPEKSTKDTATSTGVDPTRTASVAPAIPVELAALPAAAPVALNSSVGSTIDTTAALAPEATIAPPHATETAPGVPFIATTFDLGMMHGQTVSAAAQTPVTKNADASVIQDADDVTPAVDVQEPSASIKASARPAMTENMEALPKSGSLPVPGLSNASLTPKLHANRPLAPAEPSTNPLLSKLETGSKPDVNPKADTADLQQPDNLKSLLQPAIAPELGAQPETVTRPEHRVPVDLPANVPQTNPKTDPAQRAAATDATQPIVASANDVSSNAVQAMREAPRKDANATGGGSTAKSATPGQRNAGAGRAISTVIAEQSPAFSNRIAEQASALAQLQPDTKNAAADSTLKVGAHASESPAAAVAAANDAADAQSDAVAVASNPMLHSARLIERIGHTELHLGLQDGDLGRVNIRTSMAHDQITAQISVERGDLGRVLAAELPALQNRLSEQRLPSANIILQNQSGDGSAGFDQGSRQSHTKQDIAIPYVSEKDPASLPVTAGESIDRSRNLDIHM